VPGPAFASPPLQEFVREPMRTAQYTGVCDWFLACARTRAGREEEAPSGVLFAVTEVDWAIFARKAIDPGLDRLGPDTHCSRIAPPIWCRRTFWNAISPRQSRRSNAAQRPTIYVTGLPLSRRTPRPSPGCSAVRPPASSSRNKSWAYPIRCRITVFKSHTTFYFCVEGKYIQVLRSLRNPQQDRRRTIGPTMSSKWGRGTWETLAVQSKSSTPES